MTERIWMQHPETGGRAELPDIAYWRANGWEPTDDGPPPEPDLLRDPPPEAPPEAPDAEKAPGLSAAKTTKSAAAPAPTKEK